MGYGDERVKPYLSPCRLHFVGTEMLEVIKELYDFLYEVEPPSEMAYNLIRKCRVLIVRVEGEIPFRVYPFERI